MKVILFVVPPSYCKVHNACNHFIKANLDNKQRYQNQTYNRCICSSCDRLFSKVKILIGFGTLCTAFYHNYYNPCDGPVL